MDRTWHKKRLPIGTRAKRLIESRARFKNSSKFNAALALFGNNFLNKSFNTAINKLEVNNLHRIHVNRLREIIRTRMKNHTSLQASNSVIKNASIRTMTNYMSQKIGFKNSTNSEQIYNLITKKGLSA